MDGDGDGGGGATSNFGTGFGSGATATATASGAGFGASDTFSGTVSTLFFPPGLRSNQVIFATPCLGRISYNIRQPHCQNALRMLVNYSFTRCFCLSIRALQLNAEVACGLNFCRA